MESNGSGSDAELLADYVSNGSEAALAEMIRRYGSLVYSACFRMTRDHHDAEDAAQAVFVVLSRKAASVRGESLAAWLHSVARNVSMCSIRRRQQEMKKREDSMKYDPDESLPAGSGFDREAWRATLDRAFAGLSDLKREAVILRYLEGLSETEAARIAGCPVGTLSQRASLGISRLRVLLARHKLELGAPALIGLLQAEGAAAAIPETLGAAINTALHGAEVGGNAGLLAEDAIRKMFWSRVQTVATMLALSSLAAVSVFAIVERGRIIPQIRSALQGTEVVQKQPAAVPAEAEAGQSDERWEVVRLAGSESYGHLGGPAAEMEINAVGALGPGYLNTGEGGKSFYGWYDPKSGRAHRIAGNGWGYLDGPFSRARFGNLDYGWIAPRFTDGAGRTMLVADKCAGIINLRKLDFDRQVVSTVVSNLGQWGLGAFRGVALKDNGDFYLLRANGTLELHQVGQSVCNVVVQLDVSRAPLSGVFVRTFPLVLDEVNGRLYAGFEINDWWIWYWELKDGSFHGVVPKNAAQHRPKDAPGPFEGAWFYAECGAISFDPDDGEKRFIYMTRVDTWQIHRIDLVKKEVAALKTVEANKGYPRTVSFSTETASWVPAYSGHRWLPGGGGLVSTTTSPTTCVLYRRMARSQEGRQ